MEKINHFTTNYRFEIEQYYCKIDTDLVEVNKVYFDGLCKDKCKNYNCKYSCPPYSPSFDSLKQLYKNVYVILYKIETKPYPRIYNTIRMVNTVMKSLQRKKVDMISHYLEKNSQKYLILENGSCRLCKICNVNFQQPCKHPSLARYSLESTGIDVAKLVQDSFNFSLQWYAKDCFPDYQIVITMIITDYEIAFDNSMFL